MLSEDLIKGARGVEEYTGGMVTARQAYRLVDEGRLPVIRMGRTMYFRRSELEAAFRSGSVNA